MMPRRFLSTLSLRRATGEPAEVLQGLFISIHALLAESDVLASYWLVMSHYFYPRSPCGARQLVLPKKTVAIIISIHALLAESDLWPPVKIKPGSRFLSTLSLRRATHGKACLMRLQVFLSTLSLRRATKDRSNLNGIRIFLSTLSLRRATDDRQERAY